MRNSYDYENYENDGVNYSDEFEEWKKIKNSYKKELDSMVRAKEEYERKKEEISDKARKQRKFFDTNPVSNFESTNIAERIGYNKEDKLNPKHPLEDFIEKKIPNYKHRMAFYLVATVLMMVLIALILTR